MSLIIDNNGTISLYQGDSGEIVIYGLDSEKSYTVCFAIQDSKRNLIGEELQVAVTNSDNVTFVLTPEYTDLLDVYNSFSVDMRRAYYYCLNEMYSKKGFYFRITSANTFSFSCGFLYYDDDKHLHCRYYTRQNVYDFIAE